jgi:hypothetical protein
VFWCSNSSCYNLHRFSSDILLLQSVSSFFIMTNNQSQCDKIQNCTNCLVPKLSYSHPAVCSFKCWKQPTDILNNIQINGWLSNSNILHKYTRLLSLVSSVDIKIWLHLGMCATICFRNHYLPILNIRI